MLHMHTIDSCFVTYYEDDTITTCGDAVVTGAPDVCRHVADTAPPALPAAAFAAGLLAVAASVLATWAAVHWPAARWLAYGHASMPFAELVRTGASIRRISAGAKSFYLSF
jgi:hypothetical protein